MTDEAEKTQFRTRDLNIAAFMWCQNEANLTTLDQTDSNAAVLDFVFQVDLTEEGLRQLRLDYLNGKTRVEPLAFVSAQNSIRNMIHNSMGLKVSTRRKN